jgi:23S rRNA (adenine-N6)-dimethyltransferase
VGAQPWGWYELDAEWAARLVNEAALRPGSLAVDIGAGRGAISAALLDAGCRVIAVERHPRRAAYLRERFAGEAVVVVQADAADLRLPRRPYHVVANPPFAVTGAILRRLLQPGTRLRAGHLVVQEAAARRWARLDAPGAARWSRGFEVSLGARIPRRAFTPRPRVDARVLRIAAR